MIHLMFSGVFVFGIIVLLAKLYFSYTNAVKKKGAEDVDAIMSPDINEREKFFVPKGLKAIVGFLVLSVPILLIYFFIKLKNEPTHADGLWIMIDLLIVGFFVVVFAFITVLRSYVYIHEEGFEYRGAFRTKSFSRQDVEHAYQTQDFIYVKLKDFKMPVIIETIYTDNDCLYKMLYRLKDNK